MGKKTNGSANDNVPTPKESAAPAKRAGNKDGSAKPTKKKALTVAKAAAAGAAIAMAAGEAIAKIARAPRQKRSTSPRSGPRKPERSAVADPRLTYSREEIALRAYFISERRRDQGLSGDPEQDWIEAEQQLAAENR